MSIVWLWGSNSQGQLDQEGQTILSSGVPLSVISSGLYPSEDICSIAAGENHTVTLTNTGEVWSWGSNSEGQLGVTGVASSTTPLLVSLGGVCDIQAGGNHTLALLSDGRLFAWGSNSDGQLGLGLGAPLSVATPTQVPIAAGICFIAAGDDHSLAVTTDGTLYSWGSNSQGQLGLGLGAPLSVSTPTVVPDGGGFTNGEVCSVSGGSAHTLAVLEDGGLWSWGSNSQGQLGQGPGFVDLSSPTPLLVAGGFCSSSAGSAHSLGLRSDGTVLSWGSNSQGQLGLGTTGPLSTSTPAIVVAGANGFPNGAVMSISAGANHSVALTQEGTVWTWGSNSEGQLGLGNTSVLSSGIPNLVNSGGFLSGSAWRISAGANHTLSLAFTTPFVCPTDITVSATGATGALVNFVPIVSDVCVTSAFSPPSGTSFPIGTSVVSYTITPNPGCCGAQTRCSTLCSDLNRVCTFNVTVTTGGVVPGDGQIGQNDEYVSITQVIDWTVTSNEKNISVSFDGEC